MTTSDSNSLQQQPAPGRVRGQILDALERAERKKFTRPAPKFAKTQVEFLLTRVKQSTKALAERLGVTPGTVRRYRSGTITTPRRAVREALVEETESMWQPQVRAEARERATTWRGLDVTVTAYFGFTANGSSDDGRMRSIRTSISASYAAQILAARERGATEETVHDLVAEAITESYFTDWNTRAPGLEANFTSVLSIEFEF
ncbi:telomere-protecting terminal protein Tpg [Streptomyces sp. NPDC059578]|uniref:telomere-protecting terminal protein Tpg n=1 Tax=Streptomyces sp. NPDC059578 TaxID=3346874 RepID=UPI0036AAA02B